MAESKKAAKDFVDQYFPVEEPNPTTAHVFGDLFSPKSKQQWFPKKQEYDAQSKYSQRAIADGKSPSTPQSGSSAVAHCEISEPCLMSSSVDYGCRDNYPYNPDNRYPGPAYTYVEENDYTKDGSNYSNPEIIGAEWWQGSLYY